MEQKQGESKTPVYCMVQTGQHSPFLLQDFLRGIPLKLLSCDLFEEWMGALEKQNEEDRIEALKQ
jgi:hypothetical protein